MPEQHVDVGIDKIANNRYPYYIIRILRMINIVVMLSLRNLPNLNPIRYVS